MPKKTSSDEGQPITEQYDKSDLRNVMFETIDHKYAKGKLGPFEVIMTRDTGYVNATKLCNDIYKETGTPREFRKWFRLKKTKELIEEISLNRPELVGYPLTVYLDNGKYLRGTYVHPDLIIVLAQWISPKYTCLVIRIMTEYHSNQAIAERDKIIEMKDDKIDKLTAKIDKLIAINEGQSAMLEEIHDQNEDINEKLNTACNSRVVDGKPSKRNMLAIVKNNAKPRNPKKDDPPYYDFKVFRVAKRSFNSLYKAHKAKYPRCDIIYKIDYTPNSVQLWQRFLEKHQKTLDCSGCQFNLGEETTLKKTLKRIKNVHQSRYDVS